MSITTYSELQTAVGNWLARSDLTSYIPDFITLAEAALNRDLDVRQMEQRATATININASEPQYVSLPSDFNAMRYVIMNGISGKPHLEYMSHVQAAEFRTMTGDASGQPEFFAIINDEMLLVPTPDSGYTLEMGYRKNIPALSTNSTNWLLTLYPDIYLYGTLLQAAPFLKDDERIPVWQTFYDRAMAGAEKQNMSAAFNAQPVAIRVSTPTP